MRERKKSYKNLEKKNNKKQRKKEKKNMHAKFDNNNLCKL